MANESEQQDLFDWKPEVKKTFWLWKILKSKYFWLTLISVVIFFIVLFIIIFILSAVIEYFSVTRRVIFITNILSNYWLIIFGTLALIFTFLVIWLIPKWQVKTLKYKKGNAEQSEFDLEKERIKLRDDTRKTMAQIIGGTFFVLGLFVTYNTFELNREGQVTERFSKAVALLGSDDVSVRLGGLYALERISKDSAKDHQTIMEILAAYIRDKSKEQRIKVAKEILAATKNIREAKQKEIENVIATDEEVINLNPTTDIIVAVEIIKRRDFSNDKENFVFDLRNANLRGADLSNTYLIGANLTNANLAGANLSNTYLIRANLTKTSLAEANLAKADLSEATIRESNLDNADLADAMFYRADLSNAKLNAKDFNDARFQGAILYLAQISGNIYKADWHNSNLTNADFSKTKNCESLPDICPEYGEECKEECLKSEFEIFTNSVIDESTKLPQYLEPRKADLLKSYQDRLKIQQDRK